MSDRSKATTEPEKRAAKGEHGGNRNGGRDKDEDQPKRSSQAAGKDPHRGDSED